MSMQIISWEEYVGNGDRGPGTNENLLESEKPASNAHYPLSTIHYPPAITVGVFDGVHLGHQALIREICTRPLLPTVVTFKQNPHKILHLDTFPGDIYTLEQKLRVLEEMGVRLAVLIDFSEDFSKMNGRDFIGLLLACQPVRLIALGRNFRCGCRLDTGPEEIRGLAGARGVETRIVEPVIDEGRPVSSSRIRQALAAGRTAEAERLLGRPIDSLKN